MPVLESRQTQFRDSIDKRLAALLVGLESNADLKSSLDLLCFVLAHDLITKGIPRHPIADEPYWKTAFDAMKRGCEKVWGPTPALEEESPKWASILLAHLCKQVKAQAPELYHVYDEHLPEAIRDYAFVRLAESAQSSELKIQLLDYACKNIPLAFARLPGNPIKIHRDPATGQLDLEDVHLASSEHLLEINSLNKIYTEPRPSGRSKGLPKPKDSGRATIPDKDVLAAFKAKRAAKKNQSPPWWQIFHRSRGEQLPNDPKQLDALRKKYGEWALKGKINILKKMEV